MQTNGSHRTDCRCPQCTGQRPRQQAGRDWTLLGYKASTTVLAALTVILLLVVTAAGSLALGYKLGMDDGYGWQATSNIGFHVAPDAGRFPTTVTATGNYTIDGYTFVVAPTTHPRLTGNTVGYAAIGGPIYIETNRRLTDVYETCVHEKLHRTHPSAPHRWIYDVESRVVDDACLKLLYRLG